MIMKKMLLKKSFATGLAVVLLFVLVSGSILAAAPKANVIYSGPISRPLTLDEMDNVSGEAFGVIVYSIFSCAMDPVCRQVAITGIKVAYNILGGVALIDWLCDGCVKDAIPIF
jgi:hypothetical protein